MISEWIMQDITFCMAKSCPVKEYFHRAVGCHKRIASYSDYSQICNAANVYDYFIQASKEDTEK